MKAAWISDPHLDFVCDEDLKGLIISLNSDKYDCVFITGDISVASGDRDTASRLEILCQAVQKPFYFVLGNHDYYTSSIFSVFKDVENVSSKYNNLHFLSSSGKKRLNNNTCIIGTSNLYDARYGDPMAGFELTDFYAIKELSYSKNRKHMLEKIADISDSLMETFKTHLYDAVKEYDNIYALCHVPPFPEVSKYFNNQPSPIHSLPFFSSKNFSELLLNFIKEHPDKKLNLLCGHTHFEAELKIDNLHVQVARARYKYPVVYKTIEVS